MAKKMSKLKAFKGRSGGQRKRRKGEAVKKAVDAAFEGVTMIARKDGKVRFPRP
jgi:hypothetical protein